MPRRIADYNPIYADLNLLCSVGAAIFGMAQLLIIIAMTAGTGLIMWFAEMVTERGIGNGMSILIFTQIAASFPTGLWAIKTAHKGATGWFLFFTVIGIGLLVMLAIVWIEQGQRRARVHAVSVIPL